MRTLDMTAQKVISRRAAVIAAAVCVVSLIAGCASWPSTIVLPTDSPSPTGDGHVGPTQDPLDPPTTREDALAAAHETMNANEEAIFGVVSGTAPLDSLGSFESGEYLAVMTDSLTGAGDDAGYVGITGQPNAWISDFESSSASTLVSEEQSYPFGVVHMVACLQSLWEFAYASKDEQPPSELGRWFAYEMIIQYEPTRRIWLITEEEYVGDRAGAHSCPPTD